MNKILLELYLPVTMESFDVFVPVSSTVGEILLLIREILPELSGGVFRATADVVLCERYTGKVLPVDKTVLQLGLKDGSEIYVM